MITLRKNIIKICQIRRGTGREDSRSESELDEQQDLRRHLERVRRSAQNRKSGRATTGSENTTQKLQHRSRVLGVLDGRGSPLRFHARPGLHFEMSNVPRS